MSWFLVGRLKRALSCSKATVITMGEARCIMPQRRVILMRYVCWWNSQTFKSDRKTCAGKRLQTWHWKETNMTYSLSCRINKAESNAFHAGLGAGLNRGYIVLRCWEILSARACLANARWRLKTS